MIRIELEIEELALRGLDAGQAQALVAALRAELAAGLLSASVRDGLAARGDIELPGSSAPIVHSGPVEPMGLGRATARAVTQEVIR